MDEIKDNQYKPDFEIADRYINFSSELLRLSLLAITGIGGLILFSFKNDSQLNLNHIDKILFSVVLSVFVLAVGASLIHRFYASDSLSFHIAYLRTKAQKEADGRTKSLRLSGFFLVLTEYLFGIAVIIFAIAMFQFLIYH